MKTETFFAAELLQTEFPKKRRTSCLMRCQILQNMLSTRLMPRLTPLFLIRRRTSNVITRASCLRQRLPVCLTAQARLRHILTNAFAFQLRFFLRTSTKAWRAFVFRTAQSASACLPSKTSARALSALSLKSAGIHRIKALTTFAGAFTARISINVRLKALSNAALLTDSGLTGIR